MQQDFKQIHALYNSLTQRDWPMTMQSIYAWEVYHAKGFTEADLRLVVNHINNLIRANRRFPESLRFHKLIGDLERFNEDLVEARALSRIPKVDQGKASVLRATARPTQQPTPEAKPAGEILSRLEIAKKMRELRLSL